MKEKFKLLYNPFDKIAGWGAFFIGIIIVITSVLIGYQIGGYYLGAISFKISPIFSPTIGEAFLSQGIGLAFLVLLFYLAGVLFSRGVRFQDVLGTVTLARAPLIFAAISCYLVSMESLNTIVNSALRGGPIHIPNISLFVIMMMIVIVSLVWYVAMLWHAFRTSTDIKDSKGVAIFIVVIILTEVISPLIMKLFW